MLLPYSFTFLSIPCEFYHLKELSLFRPTSDRDRDPSFNSFWQQGSNTTKQFTMFVKMTLTLRDTNFLRQTRFWSSSFKINARFWSIFLKCMIDLVINAAGVIIHLLRQAIWSVICICSTFLHCVFSHVSLDRLPDRMQSHTGYICLTFLNCAFSNVSSNRLHEKMQSHTGCIWKPIVTFVVFARLFSTVCFHMCH